KNHAEGFLVSFSDGSVHFLRNSIADSKLAACFTRNGGEVVAIAPNDEMVLEQREPGPGLRAFGVSREELEQLKLGQLLAKGIGNQLSLHIYDAPPTFDFSLPSFLGETLGTFNGRSRFGDGESLLISFLITSLNAPVYVAIPVRDTAVVDEF